MLLLPTLTTLSIALGVAHSAVPALEGTVTDPIPYLAEISGGEPAAAGEAPAGPPVHAIAYLVHVNAGPAPEAPAGEPLDAFAQAIPAEAGQDDSGFGPAAAHGQLDDTRGGDGSASSIVMNGTVADNRATNVVTGANTITAGAFANASGVPMVVQNTGANVLIQNATVINLQLR